MFAFFIVFASALFASVLFASAYTTARQWAARRACYRRASLGSLVRAARKSAILRHYGRA